MPRGPTPLPVLAMLAATAAVACSKTETPSAEPAPVTSKSTPPPVLAPVPAPSAALSSSTPATSPKHDILTFESDAGVVPAARAERILHVGDSMVPLVGNYLRLILARDGRRYEIVSIPSSSTLSWARDHGMRDAMYRYAPEVVIISLGSNELFDPNPRRRAKAIRQIVSETRDRPCLWIGPPAWKKDKGFLDVLKRNVGRCRYFDSSELTLERMADGRHPSWSGSHKWASEVWKVLGGTEPVPTGDVRPKPSPPSAPAVASAG